MALLTPETLDCDILIIGGGTAGCMAAVEALELDGSLDVLIVEKAHVDRSGCLAAGMNAINAFLNPGETPESFARYVRKDNCGLIREDLVLSIAELLNGAVERVEQWGLPILKDESGSYRKRGRWNIRIHGESLKPILAAAARKAGARILNRVVATNYLADGDRVTGATGFGVRDGRFYAVNAKATICCTGGASGIYRPNNPGGAAHKMWYPPFNTGAGYAMGLRAGAEMTSLEMRFIALRTKDTICPTGTLALGFGAKQVNALGQEFMPERFGHLGGHGAPTPYRAYGPVREVQEGRGPVYMDTRHLLPGRVRDLQAAYLDMYPSNVLYWAANRFDPSKQPIEICGTEPYIFGGHCQAGYWIGVDRQTTLPGLYAAGDVAGGAPYKFVSGCWAEGVMAARGAVEACGSVSMPKASADQTEAERRRVAAPLRRADAGRDGVRPHEMEARLQKIMDEYAGGVKTYYEMNEASLMMAAGHVERLRDQVRYLVADSLHGLMLAHEVIDRIDVSRTLIQHLLHRRETRWPTYQTRTDYPDPDDANWLKFVNSRLDASGDVEIVERPYEQIVPGDRYQG